MNKAIVRMKKLGGDPQSTLPLSFFIGKNLGEDF